MFSARDVRVWLVGPEKILISELEKIPFLRQDKVFMSGLEKTLLSGLEKIRNLPKRARCPLPHCADHQRSVNGEPSTVAPLRAPHPCSMPHPCVLAQSRVLVRCSPRLRARVRCSPSITQMSPRLALAQQSRAQYSISGVCWARRLAAGAGHTQDPVASHISQGSTSEGRPSTISTCTRRALGFGSS